MSRCTCTGLVASINACPDHGRKSGRVIVAVPADTARLLTPEVLAALPALLRVAWAWWADDWGDLVLRYADEVPLAAWDALGAALEAHDA